MRFLVLTIKPKVNSFLVENVREVINRIGAVVTDFSELDSWMRESKALYGYFFYGGVLFSIVRVPDRRTTLDTFSTDTGVVQSALVLFDPDIGGLGWTLTMNHMDGLYVAEESCDFFHLVKLVTTSFSVLVHRTDWELAKKKVSPNSD